MHILNSTETVLLAPSRQLVSFHIGDRTGSRRCATFNARTTGSDEELGEQSFQLSIAVEDIAVVIAQDRANTCVTTLNGELTII